MSDATNPSASPQPQQPQTHKDLLGPEGDPAEGARDIPPGGEGSDADEEAERTAGH